MRKTLTWKLPFALLVMGIVACHSGGERPEVTEPEQIAGAAGQTLTEGEPMSVSLPFAVDDHFQDTGFMGTGQQGGVVPRPNACQPRDPSAQGSCHCYEYSGASVEFDWAGLYWLSGYDNWGQKSGLSVQAGAKRLRFRASSDPPGMPVEFVAGGIDGEAFQDEFEQRETFTLPALMEEFELDLSSVDYPGGVIGGFAWILNRSEPGMICVDDIRWE